jgi:hypothetical protein
MPILKKKVKELSKISFFSVEMVNRFSNDALLKQVGLSLRVSDKASFSFTFHNGHK